jgi:glutamine synthetase
VYGPLAMLEVDEFCAQLLADLDANGILVGQLHAEYGLAQMELAISPHDPVSAADMQLLARQTIHAAARAHGLRASFAPLVATEAPGNGWHAHSSVLRDGENLLAGGDRQHGLTAEGESWLAGLVRELPALAAIAAPSVPSLLRRRPGYFASAYSFWGVQNREASLRFMPETTLVPANAANIELKASDASGNPYLTLAAIISAGLAGIAEGLTLSDPINVDPGSWTAGEREQQGVALLPTTSEQQIEAVEASLPVRDALGEPLFGAWSAVRIADASWAKGKTPDEIVTRHRWSY